MANNKKANNNLAKIEKDLEIKKEMKKIGKLFKDIDKDTKKSVESIIQNCAFMAVTLRELQETLKENGLICEYQNGENQWGTKKSPEVEIYNTMIKNFVSSMNALAGYLPKEKGEKIQEDGFEDFVYSK